MLNCYDEISNRMKFLCIWTTRFFVCVGYSLPSCSLCTCHFRIVSVWISSARLNGNVPIFYVDFFFFHTNTLVRAVFFLFKILFYLFIFDLHFCVSCVRMCIYSVKFSIWKQKKTRWKHLHMVSYTDIILSLS